MADITLKDRFGEQKVFSGVDTVVLNTTEDGVTQVFSKGVAVSGVEIVPDFSGGDMHVSAGEDILVKTAVIKKPETLLPDNIAEGVEVAGVVGTLSMQEVLENVPVELDFTGGNQTISAPEGYLVKTAVIQKPDTLTPSNIAKDVIIAGVVGTHEGSGGVELPQLHAPTISISEDTLTITNSSNNGDFVTGYKILNNGAEVTTVTNATVDLTAVFTEANDYTITVKAIGTNFADSEDSNAVNYTNIYYSVTYNLTNCTSNNTAPSFRKDSEYSATFAPTGGYTMVGSNATVIMNGIDVTSTCFVIVDKNTATLSITNVRRPIRCRCPGWPYRHTVFGIYNLERLDITVYLKTKWYAYLRSYQLCSVGIDKHQVSRIAPVWSGSSDFISYSLVILPVPSIYRSYHSCW